MANASPAEIWNRGDYQKIAFEHVIVSELLCADLAITAGQRVLDVACGTGNTALAAARRRARVTGIDIAPRLIERARERAEAEGLNQIVFEVGDAAALQVADGSFDVVLSTFGASFLPDQVAAARELVRVTRPGGTIALTAYTRQSLPSDVYHLGADIAPPPEGAPLPAYVWSEGVRARELLGDSCSSIAIRHRSVDACFPSAAAFFDNNERFYGPVMTRMARFSEEQRERFRSGVIAILERHNRATDGTLMAVFDYAEIIAVKNTDAAQG